MFARDATLNHRSDYEASISRPAPRPALAGAATTDVCVVGGGLAGRLAAEAIAGQAERFDLFARLPHRPFPGGPWLRPPALALGMLYYRLRDLL